MGIKRPLQAADRNIDMIPINNTVIFYSFTLYKYKILPIKARGQGLIPESFLIACQKGA